MSLERVEGRWLDVSKCDAWDCESNPVTHVVFLNTPEDEPYAVGACARHVLAAEGFPYLTIQALGKAIDFLLDQMHVQPPDLPWAIYEYLLDPEAETIDPCRSQAVRDLLKGRNHAPPFTAAS